MASTQTVSVVIACPHCGTRYQVPPETLGARGRTVACAHCSKSWLAEAPAPDGDDRLFTPGEEEALDREFDALARGPDAVPSGLRKLMKDQTPPPEVVKSIAEIKAAIAPRAPQPPAKPKAEPAPAKLEKAGSQNSRGLPLARLRAVVRTGAVLALAGIIAGGFGFRTEIVRALPDLAGVYAAMGLGVNVVGLEFGDVTTVTTRRGEVSTLSVAAKIRSVKSRRVIVPPVLVTLLDDEGSKLYEWSVAPPVGDLAPGEAAELSAELTAPPEGAREVRLSFVDRRTREAHPAAPELPLEVTVQETN
jgi:predicted Zn finger-like uncharacterized protein